MRLFCTGDRAPYDAALPAGRHHIGKDQTRRSEGNDARQRQRFAHFRRRTCAVPKSVEMAGATMALFAHHHCNGGHAHASVSRVKPPIFERQLYVEMKRYNAVMAIIMRYATKDSFKIDFNGGVYRKWFEADMAMRQAFVNLSV